MHLQQVRPQVYHCVGSFCTNTSDIELNVDLGGDLAEEEDEDEPDELWDEEVEEEETDDDQPVKAGLAKSIDSLKNTGRFPIYSCICNRSIWTATVELIWQFIILKT